jgi:hypothetical protein
MNHGLHGRDSRTVQIKYSPTLDKYGEIKKTLKKIEKAFYYEGHKETV